MDMTIKEMIQQRQQILDLLYDARLEETGIRKGYINASDLKDAFGECRFNLGLLVELGHIHKQGYKYRITGKGVERAEASQP